MEGVDIVLEKTLRKDELRTVDESFARKTVENVVMENHSIYVSWEEKNFSSDANELKTLMKECRRRLRDVYGVFFADPLSESERDEMVDSFSEDDVKPLLERHLSTRERLPHYPYIFDHMKSFFGEINSVLDLGCGYNPISFSITDDPPKVHMVDISEEELLFLSSLLKQIKISHSYENIDLSNRDEISTLKKFDNIDISLCFKLFDSLETKTPSITEDILILLSRLVKKGIIVSFSKRTISGRNKIDADRDWFHEGLEPLHKKMKIVETINEIFYFIELTNGEENTISEQSR